MAGGNKRIKVNFYHPETRNPPTPYTAEEIVIAFNKGVRSLEKRLRKIENSIETANRFSEVKQEGELLKSCFGQFSKGQKTVVVSNYMVDPPVDKEISIDPSLSLQDNITQKFKKAKKLEESISHEISRKDETLKIIDRIDLSLKNFQDNLNIEWAVIQLKKFRLSKFLPVRQNQYKELSPFDKLLNKIKKFVSSDQYLMFVGSSAEENEFVTFKIGSGKDIWLHVDSWSGSHVVIKLKKKGGKIPRTTIQEAAVLAVHYSKVRGGSKISVIYTSVCNVKKVKGSPKGTVHHHFGKEIKASDEEYVLRKIMNNQMEDNVG